MHETPTMSVTLRSLLTTFAVVASSVWLFGLWGMLVGAVIAAGVLYFRVLWATPLGWGILVAMLLLLMLLIPPGMQASREAARRMQCSNNLKQIALALYNYHSEYGTLPPAYVVGADGRPWHSWRVLILPFIEEQSLYDKYDFDEPWDGPNNSKLAADRPPTYVCPQSGDFGPGKTATSYFAGVGPKTVWPGTQSRRLDEITDGPSNTILVMEAAGRGTCWMEPSDLDFEELAGMTSPDPEVIGAFAHPNEAGYLFIAEGGTVNFAMADGSVHCMPWGLPGEVLAPLLTAGGGEEIEWPPGGTEIHARPNWPRILVHGAVPLSLLLISTWLLWRFTGPETGGAAAIRKS